MKATKHIARSIIFPFLVGVGLEKLFPIFSKNKVLNLYYHGVVRENSNFFSPRHLHVNQFEKQLIYFKKYFDIISLEEAFEIKKGNKKLKRPAITISFDDGYKNNVDVALPLLIKHKIKATFFVSGVCTENNLDNLFWTDVLAFAKYFCKKQTIKLNGNTFVDFKEKNTGKSIKDFLKSKPVEYRDEAVSQLIKLCNIDERKHELNQEIWRMMDSQDISKAHNSGFVDINTHGYKHYNLGLINMKDAVNDVIASKESLEKILNKEINTICYPDGSYTRELIDSLSNLGITKHVSCDYLYPEDRKDWRILNRYGISNTTTYSSNIFFINLNFIKKTP